MPPLDTMQFGSFGHANYSVNSGLILCVYIQQGRPQYSSHYITQFHQNVTWVLCPGREVTLVKQDYLCWKLIIDSITRTNIFSGLYYLFEQQWGGIISYFF